MLLCENCNVNKATIHFTEIRNGVQIEHHLCKECAAKLEIPGYIDGVNNDFPFVQLLTGLLAAGGTACVQQDTPLQHICCPQCGMSFEEFTRVGKFGCAECYHVFGPLIDDNLKCIHGDNVHCGKKYKANPDDEEKDPLAADKKMLSEEKTKEKQMEELKIKLREAVEVENFEQAAHFRDEIKALEGGK